MTIKLEVKGLDNFLSNVKDGVNNIEPEIQLALKKATLFIEQRAQILAPYITGTLKRSIQSKISDTLGVVYQDPSIAPYGIDVEFGTGLYGRRHDYIYPVNAKALIMTDRGGNVIAWFKKSRGQRPQPYMQPAIEQSADQVKSYFEEAVKNILQRMGNSI